MREKWQKQLLLIPQIIDHSQCQELKAISKLINANPTICDYVLLDFSSAKVRSRRQGANGSLITLLFELRHYIALTKKVVDQTERRMMRAESVDAQDKVVSIFEPHTDTIVKDRRETLFGHKICLTGGASNLILDYWTLEGNPSDSDLALPMLERQKDIYGRYPQEASLDGGFASKNIFKRAKSHKIKDVCFAKKHGLKETDMCRSQYVYRRLRRFRSGIESEFGISCLKRCLGLTRCTWKGWQAFKSFVWSSIVVGNLLAIDRAKPAT